MATAYAPTRREQLERIVATGNEAIVDGSSFEPYAAKLLVLLADTMGDRPHMSDQFERLDIDDLWTFAIDRRQLFEDRGQPEPKRKGDQ